MALQQSPFLATSRSARQRITPTFIHHNIFSSDNQGQPLNVRYTPTYASTAFDFQPEREIIRPARPSKAEVHTTDHQKMSVVYQNQATRRKQAELNPCSHWAERQRCDLEFDPKNKVMEEINSFGGRTSRMRKIVELTSNPIFGSGYFWEPHRAQHRQTERIYSPQPYSRAIKTSDQQKILAKKSADDVKSLQDRKKEEKTDPLNIGGAQKSKKAVEEKKKIEIAPKTKGHSKNLGRFKSAANLQTKGVKSLPRK